MKKQTKKGHPKIIGYPHFYIIYSILNLTDQNNLAGYSPASTKAWILSTTD